jgi:hypothetical protein
MTTLSEIEAAAGSLSLQQKRELLLFLTEQLRKERAPLPAPRRFSGELLREWIDQDEEDGKRFREGG